MVKIMKYYVVKCLKCGTPFYIKHAQKTKKCTKCNKTNNVSLLDKIFSTNKVEEALLKVLELKKPKKNVEFYSASELIKK